VLHPKITLIKELFTEVPNSENLFNWAHKMHLTNVSKIHSIIFKPDFLWRGPWE